MAIPGHSPPFHIADLWPILNYTARWQSHMDTEQLANGRYAATPHDWESKTRDYRLQIRRPARYACLHVTRRIGYERHISSFSDGQ